MPIQMFAIVTDTSDHCGEVSQLTGSRPTTFSAVLTRPDSLLSSHAQVDAETISGSSHGTRNSARSVADNRKPRAKNSAAASPIVYWKNSETRVNRTVFTNAVRKVGSPNTVA